MERRMVVRLLSEIDSRPAPPAPDSHLEEMVQQALKLEISGPDALPLPPLIMEDGNPAESSDAELMARTRMMGIYESQVRARIERAWQAPEADDLDPVFVCRPLIRQHRDGRVKNVELPYDGCEGTIQMRQSLVSAIFSASPLPAPPHPEVFVDSFSLLFRSDVFHKW